MQHTKQQRSIIESSENRIVVSSSAGCGKTSTMIARILSLIVEKNIDVDKILCLTFTNNAAFEMKQKLSKAIFESKLSVTLKQKQLFLLEAADICTIDSFCIKLARKYFYFANIPQGFEILDDADDKILQDETLQKFLVSCYQSEDAAFFLLYDIFSADRTSKSLEQFIKELYRLDAVFPNGITKEFEGLFKQEDNICLKFVSDQFGIIAKQFFEHFESFNFELFSQSDAAVIIEIKYILEKCTGDFFELCKKDFSLPKINQLKKCDKENPVFAKSHERLKESKSMLKDFFDEYKTKFFSCQNFEQSLLQGRLLTQKLCEISNEFGKQLLEEKLAAGKFAFGDIEKYAFQIVSSEAINSINYEHLFVDEAQDLNYLQEEILKKIAKDKPVFWVGDSKQCIYRFRGSEPQIFETARKSCDANFSLSENFRSNAQILNFVNASFSKLMFADFAGIDYASENGSEFGDMLFGSKNCCVSDGQKPVVVCKIDEEISEKIFAEADYEIEDGENLENAKKEGTLIVNEILKLLQSAKICDEEGERNVEFSDIAVLVRGRKEFSEAVRDCILQSKIPVSSAFEYDAAENYYVNLLISHLRIIDNFYDDISLYAVCSQVFSNFELVKIKIFGQKKKSFAENFLYFEKNAKSELREKVSAFLQKIYSLKEKAQFINVYDLCNLLLTDFNLREIVLLGGGKSSVESFLFSILGKSYSENLSDFIRFTDKQSIKLTDAKTQGNSVTVSTIHKAKGLEYPIVFLVGLDNKFNFSESKKSFSFNKKLGLGMDYFEISERKKMPSVIGNAVKMKAKFETVLDEMNLLYVAMTRAKCRLYLFFAEGKKENPLYKFSIYKLNCFRDMLYFGLDDSNLYDNLEAGDIIAIEENEEILIKFDPEIHEIVKKHAEFSYNKPQNVLAKVTATEILKRQREENFLPGIFSKNNDEDNFAFGNAYHKFLEHSPVCFEAHEIEEEILRQINENILTKEESLLLNGSKLFRFFSQVYKTPCKQILKEQEFIANISASALELDGGEHKVLVQGKMDLIQVYEDKIVLYDYKFSHKSKDNLIAVYSKQLEIYSAVLSQVFNLPVLSYFYNFIYDEII